MGQSNNKAQKPNRVTVRKHGWISDSNIKEKRTGARMPGFSFGFGRNRVKQIHLKPEEAEPAGFQPETVRNQSKFSLPFLCCLSSPDDHLDVIQTERISNASCKTVNQDKVTGVVDALSENQEHKSLSLCHPLNTNSGFSKENHLTVLTEIQIQIQEKPEEPSNRFSDGFLENDCWSVMSEGTSVWSEEEEDDDDSAALSYPGMLSNRSWGKRDMVTEQIDLDKISNATFDINSLDALLDEVDELLVQNQDRKSLALYHPENPNNGFSKENLTVLTEAEQANSASQTQEKQEEPSKRSDDGFFESDGWSVWSEEDDDESAALSYPGILSDCSWEKGDMASEQIDKISNASFDINGLDALLDEVEKMLGQKEDVKLQVKPSNKNNIMDEVIRRTIAEILFAEVDEISKEQ
ncbi:uncharacterized protein LOC134325728 [Trichomycterus rosablanca]|uniref:uncharacterized protein LOC134325728 n=1 Tax=Trichomycterus rosablanca TaxID=2290929 RepID=UPI002F35BA6F